MYVTKTDYLGRIAASLLDALLKDDESGILATSSKNAEDSIATMAGVLYDIQPELAKTAAARNGYVLGLAVSIGLYLIYNRADNRQVPEKVIKNYDDAMDDLERISTGKKVLSLPPRPVNANGEGGGEESVPTQGTGLRRIGSQKKRSHNI